jgi:hypothetical protein
MPINRAPFNALVDDDGSNTKGTLWNKSEIQSVLLDPIDAFGDAEVQSLNDAAVTSVSGYIQSSKVGASRRLIKLAPSAPMTIRGYDYRAVNTAAPLDGEPLVYVNRGSSNVFLYNYAGGGQNNFADIFNTPNSGPLVLAPNGFAYYIRTDGLWMLASYRQGGPIAYGPTVIPSTSGSAFTNTAGGPIYYELIGSQLHLSVYFGGNVSGTATSYLYFSLPNGYTGSGMAPADFQAIRASDPVVGVGWGMIAGGSNGPNVSLYPNPGGNGWSVGAMWVQGRAIVAIA